ncbi:MAG: hypothetical protein KGL53_13915 [Elusimicrobia bacterium]|nr:hypothetical protein [Elusimicrobiota bacterium]
MRDQRRRRGFGPDPRHPSRPPQAVETPPEREVLTPEIPKLKEKEEERKGAGVPWYSGSGSATSELIGGGGEEVARVGSSLATRGSLLGRMAAALSNALGGDATFLGGLFASSAGRWLVLSGLVAWGGLLVGAGAKLMGGWGHANAAAQLPDLSGVGPSGIMIKNPADRSLNYVASANQGEIRWDQGKDAVKKADGAKDAKPVDAPKDDQPKADPKTDQPPPFQMPDVSQLMGKGLNRQGFIHPLTSDMSQLAGGGGLGGMPRIKNASGFKLTKTFSNLRPKTSQLGAMRRANRALSASHMHNLAGSSSRAAGQLKLANRMSTLGTTAGTDQSAHAYAANAFDQGQTIGGNLGNVAGGDGIVVPPGNGAPTTAGLNAGTPDQVPSVGPGTNATPYQSQLDAAKSMGNQAAAMKSMGDMMLMIGLALIAAGAALMGNHTTIPIGVALMAAGAAMMAMGMMMLGMSAKMAGQAQNQGNNINQQYGQQDQGNIVNSCAQQATQNGTTADNCKSTNPGANQDSHTNVHQAVQDETNANYKLGDGSSGGGGAQNQTQNQ